MDHTGKITFKLAMAVMVSKAVKMNKSHFLRVFPARKPKNPCKINEPFAKQSARHNLYGFIFNLRPIPAL